MQEKTYQITVNEKEAGHLKEQLDSLSTEIDEMLVKNRFDEGQQKEHAIDVLKTFNNVSKQLPNRG